MAEPVCRPTKLPTLVRRRRAGHPDHAVRSLLPALLAALLLAAAPTLARADDFAAVAGRPLDAFAVTRPGVVVADPVVRAEELRDRGPERAEAWCRVPLSRNKRMLKPITDLHGEAGYGGNDKSIADFDWAVIHLSAEGFGTGNETAARDLRALLMNWARVEAMTRIHADRNGSNHNVLYGLKRTMNALVPAWSMFRGHPLLEPSQREAIESWISRLVEIADVNTGTPQSRDAPRDCAGNENNSNCNNHRYMRDAMNAAWGALIGDDVRFRKGVERYVVALRQMREDGSLPLETQRGARALWYQRHAIGSLVLIAEIAANQGYDLYGMEGPAGASLHDAVAFLFAGIEEPETVLAYAQENYRPGPSNDWRTQDIGFLLPRGRNRFMAWAEPYMRRFPHHPNTQWLRSLVYEDVPLLAQRPLTDPLAGGNATCWWARE